MANVFFDDTKIMIVSVVTSRHAGPRAHLKDIIATVPADTAPAELVPHLREAWAGEGRLHQSNLAPEDIDATWDVSPSL